MAASGTLAAYLDHPLLRERAYMYPKALAQLACTTADLQVMEEWGSTEWGMDAWHRHLITRLEPTYRSVSDAFAEAAGWLAQQADTHSKFDGAQIAFTFSGHGREGDGTLLLHDENYFSVDDLLETLAKLKETVPGGHGLVVLLDSCYSGEFLLRILQKLLLAEDSLVPEYLVASSLHDEVSWESSELKHGLATYCFSTGFNVDPGSDLVKGGIHGQVTWSRVRGLELCSYATAGKQNPIWWRGGELHIGFDSVALWEGEPYDSRLRSIEEWKQDLVKVRDEFQWRLEPFTRNIARFDTTNISDQQLEMEYQDEIRTLERLLSSPMSNTPRSSSRPACEECSPTPSN